MQRSRLSYGGNLSILAFVLFVSTALMAQSDVATPSVTPSGRYLPGRRVAETMQHASQTPAAAMVLLNCRYRRRNCQAHI
jgi:hypothetical protein